MAPHRLPDWAERLGIKGALPVVALAAAAAPALDAWAGDKTDLMVVINHEEQYSVWPSEQALPKGWATVGEATPARVAVRTLAEKVGKGALYVVINHEEQYSLWPQGNESVPSGWARTDTSCKVETCVAALDKAGGKG